MTVLKPTTYSTTERCRNKNRSKTHPRLRMLVIGAAILACAVASYAGQLNVISGARYVEEYGLEVVVDDTNPAYVQDDTPFEEPRYRVRFYSRLSPMTMAGSDEFELFTAFASDDTPVFRLVVRFDGTNRELRLTAREDGGGDVNSASGVVLASGWRSVEVDWQAASAGGANDGRLDLWVEGATQTGLSGLDNDTLRVDHVRWGAVDQIDAGTSGTFYLDEFESVRQNYIGLHPVFSDVPGGHIFQAHILGIYNAGVTAGCGTSTYCPDSSTTRAQMAVFLLRSDEDDLYSPPACVSATFGDVSCAHWAAPWIEELVSRGVTAGCGGGNYCPDASVTRAQMAVFLLKTAEGSSYTPPACTGVFSDVPCPGYWAADWIEEIADRGITAGCGGGNYCPDSAVTRGQMAVFLAKTFGLPLPTL